MAVVVAEWRGVSGSERAGLVLGVFVTTESAKLRCQIGEKEPLAWRSEGGQYKASLVDGEYTLTSWEVVR